MRMFIWEDPYPVDWGMSLIVGVGESAEEAWTQAMCGNAWGEFLKSRRAQAGALKMPEPTAILDVPSAAWVEWAE